MVRGKRVREHVYKRLKDTIIREVKNGTLQENDPILSERLLSEQFGISRISTRKALKELIAEGYLYTLPGKGTFVRGITSGLQRPRTRTQILGGRPVHYENPLLRPYCSRRRTRGTET